MLLEVDMQDVTVLVTEMRAAERRAREAADLTDDQGAAVSWLAAAERYGRLADELTGAAWRWHGFDMAQRPRRRRRAALPATA